MLAIEVPGVSSFPSTTFIRILRSLNGTGQLSGIFLASGYKIANEDGSNFFFLKAWNCSRMYSRHAMIVFLRSR